MPITLVRRTMSIRSSKIPLVVWFFLCVLVCIAFIPVCVAFGAWKGYDYSLVCAKCLASKHIIEQHFLGITFSRTMRNTKPAADYERIFGHPCEHIFRKSGFGRVSHSLSRSIVG